MEGSCIGAVARDRVRIGAVARDRVRGDPEPRK